jgi:hypothetical protein
MYMTYLLYSCYLPATPLLLLPFFSRPAQIQPFQGRVGYPGLASCWFTRFCGRTNGNWQVVFAVVLVHSVYGQVSRNWLLVLHFPPLSYIIQSFGKLIALLGTCFTSVSCLAYSLNLKVEATCSSDMPVDFQQTTQCYVPEDRTPLWEPQILQLRIFQ